MHLEVIPEGARAFAAKTALINVMKECQTNKKLNSDESFTRLEPTSYSFASSKNNCNGNKSEGLVFLNPDNTNELPTYFYDHNKGSQLAVFIMDLLIIYLIHV